MSTETRRVGYLPTSLNSTPLVGTWLRALSRLASGVAAFFGALRAASAAAKQAERYYAMSSAELAEIGLTRQQIPAALLRVLDRDGR